jgi:hypothetical protein
MQQVFEMVPLVWQLMGELAGHDSMAAAVRPSRVLRAIKVEGIFEGRIDVI